MAPIGSNWMQTHRRTFGDQPLNELCLPNSHDAGTSHLSFGTSFGVEANVLTQTRPILGQLEFGVRYFDIRPTLAAPDGSTDATWNCGHYTGEAAKWIGWQGGSCVPLAEVVSHLNRFTTDNAELVVIDISHVMRINIKNPIHSTQGSLSPEDWNQLLGILSGISHRFDLRRAGGVKDKPLQGDDLNKFIGQNEAAVVVIVDGYNNPDELLQKGFWPINMSNGQKYLDLPGSSVTRTQSSQEAVESTALALTGRPNPYSVLNLATTKQKETFPGLLQSYVDQGPYPSTILLDRIENADLLTFSLAVSYQKFNIKQGLHNKVVVYGGALVTDQKVHEAIQQAIDNSGSFQVTNNNLGGDPWSGVIKSCAVFYEKDGKYRGRWARENSSIVFS